MATVTMTLEEYEALASLVRSVSAPTAQLMDDTMRPPEEPKKRKNTAYQRRYKRAFRQIAPKYKLKSGKWKAGGFKKAVKQAHKEAKR
tara:strand:- start:1602 stop:1865 length:264 start_codon:yes stop_codon:yes gene_type:complete